MLLPPGEPVARLECCPPCPNGREDSLLEEFFLEGQRPLCTNDKVERVLDLEGGAGESLKKQKMKEKK